MSQATIELPDKLVPVFSGRARYRGAYGGRGSAKTRTFAKMSALWGYKAAKAGREGIILCGREFMNSLEDSSLAEVKAAIRSEPFLKDFYEIGEKFVRTRCGRVSYSFSGLRHNLDSIKSKAKILLFWADEAEAISETAWKKVIPTVREDGSEIWVTWNPERRGSATDKRFRQNPPDDAKIVEMNWSDNPFFPDVLDQERLRDQRDRPEEYDHIWEGDYVSVVAGAYYAEALAKARAERRICRLTVDPMLDIRVYCDIGGAGQRGDAFAMWVCQLVSREIRVIDHYEAQGQVLAFHANWLKDNGYERAQVILPHDGAITNNVSGKRYEEHWEDAGFEVRIVPNQGKGAAMQRVSAARRLFDQILFDEVKTEGGRQALGFYHEKRDEERGIGLGPNHDWSSHSADAFGLMCVDYEPPSLGVSSAPYRPYSGGNGWMSI